MPRSCSICESKARFEIDRHLLEMSLTGTTIRGISRKFQVSEDALSRHRDNHLAKPLVDVLEAMRAGKEQALDEIKSKEIEEIKAEAAETISGRLEQAVDFFGQLKILRDKACDLLDQAETAEDLRSAGTFLKELREQIRLLAELEGKLAAQPQLTIINSPEWIEIRTLIVKALDPFPTAKEAIVVAIHGR